MLYQLSYASVSKWSGGRESNPQPTAWKAVTLPLSYPRLLPVREQFHCIKSAALCRIAAQYDAPGAGLRHRLPVFILHVTLDIPSGFAALDHPRFSAKLRLPDRTEEVDVQIHGRERLVLAERAGKGQAHGRIRQIAQNTAVQGSHGIGVLGPRLKRSDRPAFADFADREADQLRNRCRLERLPDQRVNAFLHGCYSTQDRACGASRPFWRRESRPVDVTILFGKLNVGAFGEMETRNAAAGAGVDSPAGQGRPTRKTLWAVQDKGGETPPLVFVLAGYGDAWVAQGLARALGPEQRVYGLHPPNATTATTARELAALYVEQLRAVQPHGPYCLGGYSAGAVMALEVATQL